MGPIRKTCDLRIFPIEMILNKYFLERTPGKESKNTIPTTPTITHSYALALPTTVMVSRARDLSHCDSVIHDGRHRSMYI